MEAKERRKKVKEMREAGMTLKKIGQEMGVSITRASQLYKEALQDEQIEKFEELVVAGKKLEEIMELMAINKAQAIRLKALVMRRRGRSPGKMAIILEAQKNDARYVFESALPARAVNVLWRAGINTFEDLKATPPERIKRLRGCGVQTYCQIMMVRGKDK